MPLFEQVLQIDDFGAVPWNEIASVAGNADCWSLQQAFQSEADRRETSGEAGKGPLEFLARLSSMMLRPDDRAAPFKPQVVLASGRRTAIPEDLSAAEIGLLDHLLSRTTSPALRARLGDLRWELARDDNAARVAVTSYLETARSANRWPAAVDAVKRAMDIAASLGKTGEPFISTTKTVTDWTIAEWRKEGDKSLAAGLTEILLGFETAAAPELAFFCDAEARRLESEGDHQAKRFIQLAADTYSAAKDAESREAVLRRLAESHLIDARKACSTGKNMIAPRHYEAAIQVLRRLPGGERDRVAELRRELAEVQPKALDEMQRISSSVDLGEMVEKARSSVVGKPVLDALQVLALSWRPRELSELRREVEEIAGKTPLKSLIPAVIVDKKGRKLGTRTALDPSDPDYERALEIEMIQHAALYRRLQAVGVIDPIRLQISRENRLTAASFAPVVDANPFVPGDRKLLFARGLNAGIHGDTLEATHLLIPQLENSLRSLLEDTGTPVSSMGPEGNEELWGLEVLLQHPVLRQMLGEATIFDLRALLIERTSSNLRHATAHGMMGDFDFFSADCIYLWWAALRLCMFPVIHRENLGSSQRPRGGL
jgi:hypothetical protein